MPKMSEIPKLKKPPEGYETDAEVEASKNHERVEFIRRKANDASRVGRSQTESLERQDYRETHQAYLDHANALDRLTALSSARAKEETHKLHKSYKKALEEYRQSRCALKTYGRWDKLFSDGGLPYSSNQGKFLSASEVAAQEGGPSASRAERKGN